MYGLDVTSHQTAHDNAVNDPPSTTPRQLSREPSVPWTPVQPTDFAPNMGDQDEWGQIPHRSGRYRNIPNHPGNIYGEQCLPSDIEQDIIQNQYWKKTVEDTGTSHPHVQLPQPGQSTPHLDVPEPPITIEDDSIMFDSMNEIIANIKKLVREAGILLMNLLISKAAKPSGTSHTAPVHYKDIAHLPQLGYIVGTVIPVVIMCVRKTLKLKFLILMFS